MGFRSDVSLPATRDAALFLVAPLMALLFLFAPTIVLGQRFNATDATAPGDAMIDLTACVPDDCVDGHCDCMFLVNSFQWPWVRIAALVAPRPLLLINSDADPIFAMSANDRVAAILERVYALHGAGDRFDAQVSLGGHAYRADIRAGAYRFLGSYLQDDPRPVTDGEIDLVTAAGSPEACTVSPVD